MNLRIHNWAARATGRGLVFALFAVLFWGGAQVGWALTVADREFEEPTLLRPPSLALNPQAGLLPLTVLDEQPDPLAFSAGGASRAYGSLLNLSLNPHSSLTSGVYISKRLSLFEALQAGGAANSWAETGLMPLRGVGDEHVLDRGRALSQQLTYSAGALQLQGSYVDVDATFRAPTARNVSVIGDRSPVDQLAAMRGMSDLQFEGKYNPGALALNTSRRKTVNEQSGHKEIGKTVTEVAHALAYQLGEGRQFKADFQSRDEEWRGKGPINAEKLTAHLDLSQRLALDYSYEGNNIEREGHKEKGRSVTEIKQSLVYNLTGSNQLSVNYRKFDEQWADKGPMFVENLAASLNPVDRLQLTYSRELTANDRAGHKEKGLTRDLTKRGAVYQLTGATRLDVNYDSLREERQRDDGVQVTEKESRDYALRHNFSGATRANLVRNLTSVTSGGQTTDIDTTQIRFEHKPGPRLNLVADWMDRNASNDVTEDLRQLALDSALGSGRGKVGLNAVYKQHVRGADDKQVDTLQRLGLSLAPSPLAQVKAVYESLNQQGPQADHDYVRTNLNLVSQFNRYTRLAGDYARETDKEVQTKSDRGLKLEFNPGWLTLAGGMTLQERQTAADANVRFADLQIKFGRPLADWAKGVSGAAPLPGAGHYGLRGGPGWAGLGDGGPTLSLIDRRTDGQPHVRTRSMGYQTMLGRRAYLKWAQHQNPMVQKDGKQVMQEVRQDLYEGGLDLSGGWFALGRVIREGDLKQGAAQSAQVLALRGAIGGGDRLTFTGGLQTLEPQGGPSTDWRFANLNLKFGRPLADWAKAASNTGLFDDHETYGYRRLPAWAAFADGGLSLQYLGRATEGGDKLIASAAGYQTMLGARTYARLSLQQNPLTDKGQVIPVDRKLFELGRRVGAKFTVLARYTTEDDLAEIKSLRTSMLGLRGRLSQRERVETVIVVDDAMFRGERYRATTYGLQYAREAGEGHYFILKGTLTDGKSATGGSADSYQVDFAYRKAL